MEGFTTKKRKRKSGRILTARIKREAAGVIAAYLRSMAQSDDLSDPATWRRVAERLGICWHDFNAAGIGWGLYISAEGERPVIAVNSAYSKRTQARSWIHELAHHLINEWVPPKLCDAADVYAYEGDVADIRHKIARDVEGLVCP